MAFIAILWAIGSVAAFVMLRKCALRDFGVVTLGGAILLTAYSLLAPAALITATILSLEGFVDRTPFNKPVWTRERP